MSGWRPSLIAGNAMILATSSSYSSQRAVTASCVANRRSSWVVCVSRGAAAPCRRRPHRHALGDRAGVDRREGCRRHGLAARRGLCGLELGLRVHHLEAPLVPASRVLLPRVSHRGKNTERREGQPPEIAEELEERLHPVMLTALRAAVSGSGHPASGRVARPRRRHPCDERGQTVRELRDDGGRGGQPGGGAAAGEAGARLRRPRPGARPRRTWTRDGAPPRGTRGTAGASRARAASGARRAPRAGRAQERERWRDAARRSSADTPAPSTSVS